MRKKVSETDEIYRIDQKTKIRIIIKGIGYLAALSYLFYENLKFMILLLPYLFIYRRREFNRIHKEKKFKLNLEFKEALEGMTAALSAGYSVENSITESLKSLRCIYEEEAVIIQQMKRMENQIHMNETVEQVFFEFASRTQIEDIENFAWILVTAKRTGGDIIKITRHTSDNISQKLEIDREIRTLLASKQYESNIMNLIPLAILIYLKVCSPSFLDPLYHNVAGITVMSIVLVVYLGALQLSRYIMDIHI